MSEVYNIPNHWKLIKLNAAAKFIDYRGKTPQKTSSGIPLITAKNVKMGFINEEPREFIAEKDYKGWMTRGIPKNGDVLFTTEAPLGNVAQLKTSSRIALAQRLITFQTYDDVNNSFLKFSLMSPQFQDLLNSKGTGTTVKGIKAAILKQLEIPLPPLSEQTAIVSKIEELLSDLENGNQQLLTAQQQLKTYRQSLLKWAFEGKLTNKNVNGELPKGWKKKSLGDIAKRKAVKALPKDFPDAKFIGMDCIEANALKPSFLHDFKNFKSAGNYFEKGQVLYGRMRPYLNKVYRAEFNGTCSGEFITLQCTEEFNPDLLKYILHSRGFVSFANHKTSGDRPRISYEEISDFPIAVAPIKEQEQIVSELESKLTVCDKIEETITTSLQQAEMLKQSILKKAFEGRLV